MMKKIVLFIITIMAIRTGAIAGMLSGISQPSVKGPGSYGLKFGTTIVMFYTPFSVLSLGGKYAYDNNLSVYAKYGAGTVDYTAIPGVRITTDPHVSTLGLEYLLSGSRDAEYTAFVGEYESATWSINKKDNTSSEIELAMDFGSTIGTALKTRYRLSLNNFNAGTESNEKISTSLKYGMSTEIEYRFHPNFTGSFDGGIYVGDTNGVIAYFGFGLGYNP